MIASSNRGGLTLLPVRGICRLLRELTTFRKSAARSFSIAAPSNYESALPCSSAAGLLALYGLPFPTMIIT